jgi:hypothetical protein
MGTKRATQSRILGRSKVTGHAPTQIALSTQQSLPSRGAGYINPFGNQAPAPEFSPSAPGVQIRRCRLGGLKPGVVVWPTQPRPPF